MHSLTYHKFEHMDYIFKCQVCLKYFATEQSLSEHVKNRETDCMVNVAEAYACGICHMKGFRDIKSLRMHLFIHGHECEICKKKFLRKENLKKHMNIHTGDCLFMCEHCLKYFHREINLKIHKKTKHGQFKCSVCKKRFEDSASLTKHVESHVDKPFKCRQCTRGFVNSFDLQRHMKTLTCSIALPYICEICGMAYRNEMYFNIHMEKEHAALKEQESLEDERKTEFLRKLHLVKHMRVHEGEVPYKCDICEKKFTRKIQLKLHLHLHTGNFPFECETHQKV